MQTKQHVAAYDLLVEAHALYTNKSEAQIRAVINPTQFEEQIRQLHSQWQQGEFSFGRLTELAEVAHLELWEILEALDLPIHR